MPTSHAAAAAASVSGCVGSTTSRDGSRCGSYYDDCEGDGIDGEEGIALVEAAAAAAGSGVGSCEASAPAAAGVATTASSSSSSSPPRLRRPLRRRRRCCGGPISTPAVAVAVVVVVVVAGYGALLVPFRRSGGDGNPDPQRHHPQQPEKDVSWCGDGGRSSDSNFAEEISNFLDRVHRLSQGERCAGASAGGGKVPCTCFDPVVPATPPSTTSRGASWPVSWKRAFDRNLELVRDDLVQGRKLDVVLVGDSITEHWHGTSMAQPNESFQDNLQVYRELFRGGSSSNNRSGVGGLALGISGDRCANLLYRLRNGEMGGESSEAENTAAAARLNPRVWWILIGTNDYATGDFCNVDSVVAGNIAVVRYLRQQRPDAAVVVQSLLPVLPRPSPSSSPAAAVPVYWDTAYSEINRRLECYARSLPNVHFFNATPIFFADDQRTVDYDMLPDGIHPAGKASRIWGNAIVQKVREIVREENSN